MNDNVEPNVNLSFDLNVGREPLVSVGIVNCNRLHYLKSCLESFLLCTEDYSNKEVVVVDNASTEDGTEEYLQDLESRGHRVIRMTARDPSNEFAKGLNTIVRETSGDYLVILQGDMQFTLSPGWLRKYVKLYELSPMVGCITFDAQRTVTNLGAKFSPAVDVDGFKFVADFNRPRTSGAADVMYHRQVLNAIGPWSETNDQHEYTGDSESKMLQRVNDILTAHPDLPWWTIMPLYPVSISIYTDSRGTNARIRNYRRYGDYWPPKVENLYYQINNYDEVVNSDEYATREIPWSIEEIAAPEGDWSLPKDATGAWLKNPIRPEEATEDDWVDLPMPEGHVEETPEENVPNEGYLDEWLSD